MADNDKAGGLGEILVKVTTALGANESKMRWRVQRYRMRREKAARRSERRAQHVGYEHKKCPSCRGINDKNDKICAHCGAALSWKITQMIRRAGLGGATSGSAILIGAFIAVYIAVLGTQTGSLEVREMIVRWAAEAQLTDASPNVMLAALVINPGLIGLLACALAVFLLGREIEELYGRFSMVALFVATGFIGVLGHHAIWSDKVALGATPGLFGLIGVGLVYGHRRLREGGRELRDLMFKWLLCVAVLLLIMVGNIVAELFALAAGGLLGAFLVPAHVERQASRIVLGLVGVAAVAYATYEAIARLAIF